MQLLYATKNNSKIDNMKRRLKDLPIELLTPKDLDLKIDVEEDGKTPSENALKKATAYYEKTKIPAIAGDSGLYIQGLPQDKQPGLFVRRVGGKELSDEEMIEHYSKMASSLGGSVEAYYVTGLAIVNEYGFFTTDIEEDHFILTQNRDKKHNHRGNPLDVITIDPTCKKYYSEMTVNDFKNLGFTFEKGCIDFIKANLIDLTYEKIAEKIKENRPLPLRKFDQTYMKTGSMIFQAKQFYHYLENKNVVFLGDGDGAELMYGLLLAKGLVEKVKGVTLLDFDERILNYHRKVYEKNCLSSFYQLNLINYNVLNPVPKHLKNTFDMFYINPPYGSKNKGFSCITWLTRCLDLCKDKCYGCIIIPCSDEYQWSIEAMETIQKYLIDNGFIIREFYPNIHHYFLDIDLTSSTLIVERIRSTQNKYSNEKLPEEMIKNLYGTNIDMPISIIDDGSDYGIEKY